MAYIIGSSVDGGISQQKKNHVPTKTGPGHVNAQNVTHAIRPKTSVDRKAAETRRASPHQDRLQLKTKTRLPSRATRKVKSESILGYSSQKRKNFETKEREIRA